MRSSYSLAEEKERGGKDERVVALGLHWESRWVRGKRVPQDISGGKAGGNGKRKKWQVSCGAKEG